MRGTGISVRNQDELLKEKASDFLERFRGNSGRCHLSAHLRTRPLHHEWLGPDYLIVHLDDVSSVNEMEMRLLQKAFEVRSYWTITPLHPNRMRISFQCRLTPEIS
jgi:hypothetical protein